MRIVVVACGRTRLEASALSSASWMEAIPMRTTGERGRIYRGVAAATHCVTSSERTARTCSLTVTTGRGPSPSTSRPHAPRTTVRRGGFDNHDAAETALRRFLEGEAGGFNADPNQSVADYLTAWLTAKALVLKQTTTARYRDYVHNDLVPAFGTLKLDELGHRHIAAFVTGGLATGRGRTTLYRCLATLSSALGDAVRQHRLPHNPASPPTLHRPPSPERRIWTADEAVRFLQHCHHVDPDMADLFEFLIDTGMRKGEALAAPGRHHHHHRRSPAHRRLQDPAAPHPLDHRQRLQPPHPTSRPRSRRHHRPHPHPGPEAKRPTSLAGTAATTTRPHPAPPRSPPPAPLPRPDRFPPHRRPTPKLACDQMRPPAFRARKRPPSHG
ncbi:site-specific integrase [Streptomyces sp. NBC_01233]|uniref:site-specific integrase n=1 Tax=Streptomyces sp. NBC_01233 TaxID=2903787 RepID=UPI003FA39523